MFHLILLCFGWLAGLFRSRAGLALQNLVLRQQLTELKWRHPRPLGATSRITEVLPVIQSDCATAAQNFVPLCCWTHSPIVLHETMALSSGSGSQNSHDRDSPRLCHTELAKLDDEALMLVLREGQHDALAVLFDRYHRLVMNVGLRILRDAGEAEDLTQSVFLEVFRAAAQFDPAKGTTKVWLLQYAYHRAFNRRHYLSLRGLYDQVEKANGAATPIEREATDHRHIESSHLVRQALKSLNGTQRQILQLAFYEGLTMREISERTGKSFDSVRHNYYRCLEKLRCLLCERHEISETNGERVPDVES